jgi:hypothetical protein
MENCAEKLHHKTEREAMDHLAWARRTARRKGLGGGQRLRSLNVYQCPCGGGWCVGRDGRDAAAARRQRDARLAIAPLPQTTLTPGQQRRAEKRAAEKAEHDALYADYHQSLLICRMLTDREIARMEALGIPRCTPEQKGLWKKEQTMFTDEQRTKLCKLADVMMNVADALMAKGIDPLDPAVVHLAEGHVAINKLLYPDGMQLTEGEVICPCGQPASHE